MREIVRIALLVINVISFALSLMFGAVGVYEQITGPAGLENLLATLHIPLTYNQFLFLGFACVGVMIITYIVRTKIF